MQRLDPEKKDGPSVTLAVRVTAAELAVLDAEVARMESLLPGQRFTRSNALRSILASRIAPSTTATPKPKGSAKGKRER